MPVHTHTRLCCGPTAAEEPLRLVAQAAHLCPPHWASSGSGSPSPAPGPGKKPLSPGPTALPSWVSKRLLLKPVSLLLFGDADCFHTSVSVTSSSHGPWPSSTARLLSLHRRKAFRGTAAARQGQRVMPVPAAPAAPRLGGTRPGPGVTAALCVPSSDSGRYTAPF